MKELPDVERTPPPPPKKKTPSTGQYKIGDQIYIESLFCSGIWIPVDTAVPPPFERVLVFDPNIPKYKNRKGKIRHKNQLVIGYYMDPPGLLGERWFVPDGSNPTHWMPLPNYPNKINTYAPGEWTIKEEGDG